MEGLYALIGEKLKHVFTGYHAWIIGYRDEHFSKIGLAPSIKIPLYNGALECELREYIIFDGQMKDFKREGGSIRSHINKEHTTPRNKSHKGERFDRDKAGMDRHKPNNRRGSDSSIDKKTIAETPASENPLAARRNENALKAIINRRPTLQPSSNVVMRSRKGWKKPSNNNNESQE
jgi:putative N6-adenine-specific DNA methylase